MLENVVLATVAAWETLRYRATESVRGGRAGMMLPVGTVEGPSSGLGALPLCAAKDVLK